MENNHLFACILEFQITFYSLSPPPFKVSFFFKRGETSNYISLPLIQIKHFYMKIFTLSLLLFISSQTIFAQIVGSNVFIKGNFVEAGINECGAFGSDAMAPVGYHPTEASGLSFVADSDMDGWATGSPNYCGDYSVPGSPVEGWAIQIGASVWINTDQFCGSSDIPGSITDYTTAPAASSATWEGNIIDAALNVEQQTIIKTNKRYMKTTITLTNIGATPLSEVYYMRNIDPDNDQPWSGDFTTDNIIVSNPPIGTDALVTSEGIIYGCYLGIGARNSNARVSYGNFATYDGTPSEVWNGTGGYSITGGSIGDIANSIAFYIPTIPAGGSETISFVYIFSPDAVEEALAATAGGFVCETPTGITSTVSTTTANINWTPVAGATGYTLKYRPTAGGAWTTVPVITPPVTITGLVACTSYDFKISTTCAGAISPVSSGTFTTSCVPCETAPTGLFADNITTTSAKLHWDVNPDAIKYKVSYAPVGGTATVVNATSNFKTISGLAPGTTYNYKVRSVCAGGILSDYSATASFTTLFRLSETSNADGEINIYPNPAADNFTIALENFNEGEANIKLFDMLGNIILEDIISVTENNNSTILNVSAIANGMYLLSVEQNGFTLNKQVVIAK